MHSPVHSMTRNVYVDHSISIAAQYPVSTRKCSFNNRFLFLDPKLQGSDEGSGPLQPRISDADSRSHMEGGAFSPDGSSSDVAQLWDLHLNKTAGSYQDLDYNIMARNCHAFVSDFLNSLRYMGSSSWSMVHLVRRKDACSCRCHIMFSNRQVYSSIPSNIGRADVFERIFRRSFLRAPQYLDSFLLLCFLWLLARGGNIHDHLCHKHSCAVYVVRCILQIYSSTDYLIEHCLL